MRKTISTSLVLVALSLIGFVILQINWVSNIIQVQQQKIIFRTESAVREVSDSLHKYSSINNLRYEVQVYPSTSFRSAGPYLRLTQILTSNEIKKIINNVLAKNEMDNCELAYSITYGGPIGLVEYYSPNLQPTIIRLRNDSVYFNNSYTTSGFINSQNDPGSGSPIANEVFNIIVPNYRTQAWRSLTWILIGSALLTLITVSAFYLTVRTMLQQRRLSKIKSDFINNMTHEFKTPLATISLAVDALHNPKVQGNTEKTQYFSGIIKEENKRMGKQVETILQAALMEKEELKLNTHELHLHEIIQRSVNNFSLQLVDKSGEVITYLNATNDAILGDEVHITNLVNNLIDNAIKYSKPDVPPRIVVTTTNTAKSLVLQVKDNGIGMSKDSVKRIFEKFYRAHTGNIHNVKGFGLGMTYVKDIVDAHKGKIKVDSTLGKGSTFTIELPLA